MTLLHLLSTENQIRSTPVFRGRCVEMQHNNSNSVTDFQQLWRNSTMLWNRFYDDPKVALVRESRVGVYLSSRPLLAVAALVFSAMAALPVGLFLSFAVVTIIISALGFVSVEVFLLFVAGLVLLCVLSGIALFSLMVSLIFTMLYVAISNILNYYYPHLTKQVQMTETECKTSKLKETQ